MVLKQLKCPDMYKKIELKPKHKNTRSVRSGISGNYGKPWLIPLPRYGYKRGRDNQVIDLTEFVPNVHNFTVKITQSDKSAAFITDIVQFALKICSKHEMLLRQKWPFLLTGRRDNFLSYPPKVIYLNMSTRPVISAGHDAVWFLLIKARSHCAIFFDCDCDLFFAHNVLHRS